jgi:hypothetical protein
MVIQHKDFSIEVVDHADYTFNSGDNVVKYDVEYFDGEINNERIHPTSKRGVRVKQGEIEIASAIMGESGRGSYLDEHSFIVRNETLLVCCGNKVYVLAIPDLRIKWYKQLDFAACLGIYSFNNDLLVHGEVDVTRIDDMGVVKWSFSGRNIFVSLEISDTNIKLSDSSGNRYFLNAEGKVVELIHGENAAVADLSKNGWKTKLAPYIRFILGSIMFYRFFTVMMSIETGRNPLIILTFCLVGLLLISVVLYCVIEGIQELKEQQLISAKFFRFYGLFSEVWLFAGGVLIFARLLFVQTSVWYIVISLLWIVSLLILIVADIRKIRLNSE